ncbi:PorT family protein [Sphingobacterium olei]|uniref:PorT family protein n=1 Tax=Sphingobacterium olei TaxID=2571155 RepID=A0A4U0P5Q1_9SPHI|nr:PorT family protein [Sphingobacterium olei]
MLLKTLSLHPKSIRLVYFRYIIILFILCAQVKSHAQQYEFGITGFGTGYMGDINPDNPFYYQNIGGGLSVKYNLNPTWGIKAGFNYIALHGNDLDSKFGAQQDRALQFNNNLKELSVTAEFNFFRFIAGRAINRYTPYLLAGVSVALHDPYINLDGTTIKLRELQLEYDAEHNPDKYSKIALSVPFGLGFKHNIRGPWSIGAEIIYRTTFNDNIDNVSKNYATSRPRTSAVSPETWDFLADPSGQLEEHRGKARGNGKNYDGFMTAGFTLTYTLISAKCYWWQ